MSNFYKITSKKYLRALTWRKTTYTVSYLLVLESRVSQKVALNRLRPYLLSIFECFRTVFEQKWSLLWKLQTGNGHFRSKSPILKPMEFYFRLKWSILQKKTIRTKKLPKINKILNIWNCSFSTEIIIFCPREIWIAHFRPKLTVFKIGSLAKISIFTLKYLKIWIFLRGLF